MSAICRFTIALAIGSTLLFVPFGAHAQATPEASPGAACGDGRILFAPEQADGSTSGLIVADATTGDTIASFAAPSIQQLYPLSTPGFALATVDDGPMLLIDTKHGTATALTFPEDVSFTQEIYPRPADYPAGPVVALYDGQHLLFLDTRTATVTDLRTIAPDTADSQFIQPILASDGRSLLVWEVGQNTRSWLVPLGDLSESRPLGPSDGSLGASFTPDGSQVIYSSLGTEGSDQIVYVEPVDGSAERREVLRAKRAYGIFLDDSGRIIGDRTLAVGRTFLGQTALIEPDAEAAQVLFPHEINAFIMQAAPDGSHVLVGVENSDANYVYSSIDIASGQATLLPEANGLIVQGVPGSRYRLVTPPPGGTTPNNPTYLALDLGTGTTAKLLTLPTVPGGFAGLPNFSADGSVATFSIFSAEQTLVWRLDLAAGTATQISDGMTTGGMISPDGCNTLLIDTGSEPQTSTAQVLDAAGKTIASLTGTRMAIWLAD